MLATRSARLAFAIMSAVLMMFPFALAHVAAADADDPWPGIRKELFAARDIAEGDGAIELTAPVRAEDAAVVPITMPSSTSQSVLPAPLGSITSSFGPIIELSVLWKMIGSFGTGEPVSAAWSE